jgi:hypothetical protein
VFDRLDKAKDGFIDCADLVAELGDEAACEVEEPASGASERRLSFQQFCALLRDEEEDAGGNGAEEPCEQAPPPPADETAAAAAAAGVAEAASKQAADEDAEDAQARQLEATVAAA